MPRTPKANIEYKNVGAPKICKATILDAGFRRQVDRDSGEDLGTYLSIALIAEDGQSHTARMRLNGKAKPITLRTLKQLEADLVPKATPTETAEALARSLQGKEVAISVTKQQAIDKTTGGQAVDDKGQPLEVQDNVSIRTNDLEAGADFVADLFKADEEPEA